MGQTVELIVKEL